MRTGLPAKGGVDEHVGYEHQEITEVSRNREENGGEVHFSWKLHPAQSRSESRI